MPSAVFARTPLAALAIAPAILTASISLFVTAQEPKPSATAPKPAAAPTASKPAATPQPTATKPPVAPVASPAPAPPLATYAAQRDFLAKHTKVLELTDGRGALVAICPEWQGRVMTSSCEGPDGPGFGYLNERFINSKKHDPHFNNYGGEDRFWLAPEAGQFSLWFAPGKPQTPAEWFTPPALNTGPFAVSQQTEASFFHMTRGVQLQNAKGTKFDLAVARDVRLLSAYHFGEFFGAPAAKLATDGKLKLVGFESRNVVTNKAKPLTAAEGLVSIWTLGMFRFGPETVVVVPYRSDADPAKDAALGPIVRDAEYFGKIPPEQLRVLPNALLWHGDRMQNRKLGISPRRAMPYLGAIDFVSGTLTLVHFSLPNDPAAAKYVNNEFKLPQADPLAGDVVSVFTEGSPSTEPKPRLGEFYELESLSPTQELATGQSLMHHHRTFHLRGDAKTLAAVVKTVLGVDEADVRKMTAK